MKRGFLVLAVAVVFSLSAGLTASAGINEGFDGFQIGVRPAGWEFVGCERNADASMTVFGDEAPGIQLGRTARSRITTVEYELDVPGDPSASELSFFIERIGANPSSALQIREWDGGAWSQLTYWENPGFFPGDTLTLALNASTSQRVEIEYRQALGEGDVVIDDVAITNVTIDPPTPPVPGPMPDYLVVAADDYSGDGTSDIAIYEPDTGEWIIDGVGTFVFGVEEFDVPAPGDYNGDGRADLAYFDRATGRWYAQSAPGEWILNGELWGVAGDVPVPGDYSGDGTTDLAVWRPSTGMWYVRGVTQVRWGYDGIIPAPGDYTGDGSTDIAYINTADFATWRWFVLGVADSQPWGLAGDIPVPGVFSDEDGRTFLATYRPSNSRWWYTRRDGTGTGTFVWGLAGDVPVVGDFDGDGVVDATVFRASDQWLIRGIGSETLAASPSAAIVVGATAY